MNKRSILLTPLLLLCSMATWAQNITVGGIVSDEAGEPLPSASIVAKPSVDGQVRTTVTADSKGQFSIACLPTDILTAYFLGYDDAVVPVEGKHIIDIVMQPSSATRLNESVVVGYGSVSKSDLTGSVANVKMGDVRSSAITGIDQALQGRIAGAEIMSTTGDPGAGTSIRIRGTRSISASNEPLIVLDGVIDAVTDLNEINPADIESISVLKDASSTAIYGARGSNGVILITTKEAAVSGNVSITAKFSGGVSMLPSKLDIMNATQFANYWNEFAQLGVMYGDRSITTPVSGLAIADPYSLGKGTDWIDEITRVAPYNSEQISISGMMGKTKYYASFNHTDNRGIIKNSGVRDLIGRFNASTDLFRWLNAGIRLSYNYRNTDENVASVGGTGLYNSAIYLSPLMSPDAVVNPLNTTGAKITLPTYHIKESTKNALRSMFTIAGYAIAKINDHTEIKTQASFFRFDRNMYQYWPSTLPSRSDGQGGSATRQYYNENKITWDNTFNWNRKFGGKHYLGIMAGSSLYSFVSSNFSLSGQ